MQNYNYKNPKWIKNKQNENDNIRVEIDGITSNVPIDEANIHYAEIKQHVDAGELTIEEAD